MNSAQNKGLPRTETITVTLLVMGAKEALRYASGAAATHSSPFGAKWSEATVSVDHTKTFYSKAAAREYFLKWHESVNAYPLVTVGGRELPTITAARRYFKIKGSRSIPWAEQSRGGRNR